MSTESTARAAANTTAIDAPSATTSYVAAPQRYGYVHGGRRAEHGDNDHNYNHNDDDDADAAAGTPSTAGVATPAATPYAAAAAADGPPPAKRRQTGPGLRGVSHLTPEKLAKKRANGMCPPPRSSWSRHCICDVVYLPDRENEPPRLTACLLF